PSHRCGGRVGAPLPLRSSSVSVLIRGFVADVGCELLYRNEEPGPMEVVFKFPVDAEAAVYAFQAWLGGACIQAQLHEKKQGRRVQLLPGESAPGEEAVLTLRYVCELPLEPDGAARYVLLTVLHPRYMPHGWDGEDVTQGVLRVPQRELPYILSATLQSPHGINRVLSNCPLTHLSYTAGNQTTAQVSLAQPHKPSVVLEARLPGAKPGSLMGDPAVMVTLLPSVPEVVPAQSRAGEFILLLDRSGSMACPMDSRDLFYRRLHPGCYFNICGFGSEFEQSVEYTQQTMAESLQRVQLLQANLGGTEILEPLRVIYRSPCWDGHPRQLFVFTDGEVENTQDVIREVWRHRGTHRCFSFGIGDGVSIALIKGIARAAGGSAEFITGQDRMQPKVLQSLKRALQPAVTGISLSWDLPPGMQAQLLHRGPEVIFAGQRCLIYAQLCGQPQPPDTPMGGITLQYGIQDQTYKERLHFPLQPQDGDMLTVHQLAAKSLLLELEGAVGTGSERARHLALETSLSSGVICSLTAYVGVDTERGQPVQGPLVRRDVPLAGNLRRSWGSWRRGGPSMWGGGGRHQLVSLQNADGSWDLDPQLAAVLGVSETNDMTPSIWATVLAVIWLHDQAMGQRDEWELLEAKAVGWVQDRAGERSECLEAANALLDCSVGPAVFGL
uniref:VIT domain-containing protein n=1 Tax=Gopherus evgoodei TaxID=1825980 RepID=A0A8C5EXE2_9SAUR